MKFFTVSLAVILLAAVGMAQEKTGEVEAEAQKESAVAVPKEDLKGAESAYLAYSYAAYPYNLPVPTVIAAPAVRYVVPPAATVLFRRR